MAEEKKSAGGFWGPFEVLVIIILVIGFLSNFPPPNNKETPKEPIKKAVVKSSDPQVVSDNNFCGLTVSRPKPLEAINNSVVLSGKTEGCDWSSTENVALFAQVIDNKGTPISAYTTITPSSQDNKTTYFYNEILLSETPKTNIGYLILVPAQRMGEQTKTVRIPLKFSQEE